MSLIIPSILPKGIHTKRRMKQAARRIVYIATGLSPSYIKNMAENKNSPSNTPFMKKMKKQKEIASICAKYLYK